MKKKNTIISFVLILSIIFSSLSFNGSHSLAAKKVKLNKSSISLYIKKTYTLKLLNIKKKPKVKWSTSNKKIATVSSKGKITAKKAGKCNIYAKYGKKKYKCKITVKKKAAKVTPKPAVKKTPVPTSSATKKPDVDDDTERTFPPNVTVKPEIPVTNTPVATATAAPTGTTLPAPTKKPLFTSNPGSSSTPGVSNTPAGSETSKPSGAPSGTTTPSGDNTSKPSDTTKPDNPSDPVISAAPVVSATPIPTALPTKKPSQTAPSIIVTTPQTVTPDIDSTDADLDAIAKNVTAKVQAYYGHLLITLTNTSTEWINTLNVSYSFYNSNVIGVADDDKDEYAVITGATVQSDIAPGETRYAAVDTNGDINLYGLYLKATDVTLSVSNEETNAGNYQTVDKKLIDIDIEDADADRLILPITIKNRSDNDATVSYLLYLYDKDNKVVDIIADSISVGDGESTTASYGLPYYTDASLKNVCLATDVKLITSCASSFIERDYAAELLKYASNISVTASTVQYLSHAELTVKNNNSITLSQVAVSSTFYDSNNVKVYTDDSSLLSIMPGETQYIAVKIDPDILSQIDLSKTQFDVTVQEDNASFSYSKALDDAYDSPEYEIVGTSINLDRLEAYYDENGNLTDEPTIDVSITNYTTDNIDVSFKLLFTTGKSDHYDVYTESVTASAGETTTVTLPMPYTVNEDGSSYILENGLKYKIVANTAHRLTDITAN